MANATVLTSPRLGTPLSFSAVEAVGRTLPSMTPVEMLAHLIGAYGMAAELAAVTGIPGDGGLAAALMKYLNGQWWYAFNTADAPIDGYIRVLDMFAAAVGPGSLPSSTAAYLGALGRILSTADAYAPGRSQPSFDKQFVRDYLDTLGWDKKPPAPSLPGEVVRRTLDKYREAHARLTGGERPLSNGALRSIRRTTKANTRSTKKSVNETLRIATTSGVSMV